MHVATLQSVNTASGQPGRPIRSVAVLASSCSTSVYACIYVRHNCSGLYTDTWNMGGLLLLWLPYGIWQTIIFSSCFFLLSSFFNFLA